MNLDPVFVKLTAAKETLREVWVRSYRHSYLLNQENNICCHALEFSQVILHRKYITTLGKERYLRRSFLTKRCQKEKNDVQIDKSQDLCIICFLVKNNLNYLFYYLLSLILLFFVIMEMQHKTCLFRHHISLKRCKSNILNLKYKRNSDKKHNRSHRLGLFDQYFKVKRWEKTIHFL